MDDEPEKAPRKPPRKKKEEAGTPKWLSGLTKVNLESRDFHNTS
jgi:hypothetical protein